MQAPPDSLARSSSGVVRHFNRYELKYIVPAAVAQRFRDALDGYMDADAHSGSEGYPVHSIYWDSPDLRFFWEKIDGEKFRRKLRFRLYGNSGQVFVEIKQRTDRTVQKRRTPMLIDQAVELFGTGNLSAESEDRADDRILMEALFLCRYHDLAPRMAVAYRRHALVAKHEHDVRVTFDQNLRFDAHGLELTAPFEGVQPIIATGHVVVEIKYCNRVPLWLVKLVEQHGLELTRISKYCSAVDAAYFERQNT